MTRVSRLKAIAVVIPAHNEEQLLTQCLASVNVAVSNARRGGLTAEVWLVLDACTDRSARIAQSAGANVVSVDVRNVGVARQAGVDAALQRFAHIPTDQLWLAHTDADSVVPPHWLTHQSELADEGIDIAIGTVRPDFEDLSAEQTAAWWSTHTPGVANGHVHGANLGLRANVFLAAGGFAPVPLHEDAYLVEAVSRTPARIHATDTAWVQTSGRQVGRARGGYADYLKDQLVPLAQSSL